MHQCTDTHTHTQISYDGLRAVGYLWMHVHDETVTYMSLCAWPDADMCAFQSLKRHLYEVSDMIQMMKESI